MALWTIEDPRHFLLVIFLSSSYITFWLDDENLEPKIDDRFANDRLLFGSSRFQPNNPISTWFRPNPFCFYKHLRPIRNFYCWTMDLSLGLGYERSLWKSTSPSALAQSPVIYCDNRACVLRRKPETLFHSLFSSKNSALWWANFHRYRYHSQKWHWRKRILGICIYIPIREWVHQSINSECHSHFLGMERRRSVLLDSIPS